MYLKAVILSLLLAQTCLALYCRGRDWQRIGFKCYTFENRRMTYFAARSRCHARGGTMFEPENLRQFRAVAGRVQSPTWLGINDRYREGRYVLIPNQSDYFQITILLFSFVYDSDNTLIPFTYWRYSQPDNGYMRHYFGSSDGQHCVAFNPRFRGSGWSDDNCRRFKYVICQTDPIRYHHDHGRHRSAALTTALAPVEPIANQAYMVSRSAAVVEPLLLAAGLKNGFTDGHTGMTMIGSHLPTDKPRCYAQANRLIVETQVRRKMSLRTCHRYCRASRLCKVLTIEYITKPKLLFKCESI